MLKIASITTSVSRWRYDARKLPTGAKITTTEIITCSISFCINCLQKKPTILFAAISTTDVGVATFSLIRKSKDNYLI
uniref:Bm1616 n=1 Tax=Brugia malayi TaxID=6279 RepID=A0A1I9G5U3_BRUMA|nr:Bm1616 [Brugia malayi]